jgi:hypothetical protein
MKLLRPLCKNRRTATRTRGGTALQRLPSPRECCPRPLPCPPAWLLLLLPSTLFLLCSAAAVCYMVNDLCHRMWGKVVPVQGRRRPRPGACLPAPPGTRRPNVRWGHHGGGAGHRSWGMGAGTRVCGAAAAAIVPGKIRKHYRQPDAGSYGPGPVPVRGMARQLPVPHKRDKGCCCQPTAAGQLLWLWPGGDSC